MRYFMHLYYDDWWTPKKGNYPLPCQSIESLTYDYSETKGVDNNEQSRFMVIVHFPNLKYRQIAHVQEYDVESLVGNIGGYIGLFLGYSLINFPRFIISLLDIIRKKLVPIIKKKRTGKDHQQNSSIIHNQSPCTNPADQSEVSNANSVTLHNQTNIKVNNTPILDLKNVRNELISVVKKIDGEVAFQTSPNASTDYLSDYRSMSPRSPIRKVRITEWNNQSQMPRYI